MMNARIEALLNGNLHIDIESAIEAYANFLQDVDALNRGVPLRELRYTERKLAAEPRAILTPTNRSINISNRYTGRDERERESKVEMVDHPAVGYLEITGVMRTESDWCSHGMATVANWIMEMGNDPNLVGTLIRVRSGGGESMAGDILRGGIQASSHPVVVYYDLMGSAALNGALDADEIIASSPAARAGSIGSYISLNRKLIEQYSAEILDIYSDLSPGKNAEWRAFLQGDLAPLTQLVRTSAMEFREAVREARNLRGSEATIEETLSGGMFDAKDARARGLNDGIGTLPYALRRVLSLAQAR